MLQNDETSKEARWLARMGAALGTLGFLVSIVTAVWSVHWYRTDLADKAASRSLQLARLDGDISAIFFPVDGTPPLGANGPDTLTSADMRRIKEAEAKVQQLAQLAADAPELVKWRAYTHFVRGENTRAISLLIESLKDKPNDIPVLESLLKILFSLEYNAAANATVDLMLSHNPDNAGYHLAAAIYRVGPDGSTGQWAVDPRFGVLDGIEFHPDGYLLVASDNGRARLLRIPIDEPDAVSEVDTPFAVSGDGIVFRPDGSLAVVEHALATEGTVLGTGVTLFTSNDGWQSAAVAGSWISAAQPTTAAVRGDDVHAIFPYLFDTMRDDYQIIKASFSR